MEVKRYPNTTCQLCGTAMYRRPNQLRKGMGRYCSRACRNRAHPPTGKRGPNPKMQGERNPAWKGGVTLRPRRPPQSRRGGAGFTRPRGSSKGSYPVVKYVRAPAWALLMARRDGYVMEHRLVMAALVGRLLTRTECVHHLDHDPLNNAPSNLELWPTNADHKRGEVGRFVDGVANRWASPLAVP